MRHAPSHIAAALLLAALASGGPAAAPARAATWANSVGMEFAEVPPGSFTLGTDGPTGDADERPAHVVTLTRGFWCGTTEVTQAQWESVTGKPSPSLFQGGDRPVERVTHREALDFIEALNRREGTGRYRLPTEAEWAYAAKAGTLTPWSFGKDPGEAGGYAWFRDNSGRETHPAGGKRPNPWGLFDMHG
ncbi:MAG: formylglycine-generating enzyme family protein, partial [Deltaproteobacteria bacterium]|nr:formylglycine-generating enzyme family protein [Deltaproteobacteria bacterium]